MAGPTLYELTSEFQDFVAELDRVSDKTGEIPEELAVKLDLIQGEFRDKIDAVLRVRVGLVAHAEGIDAEINRLSALRDGYARRADWLKSYVFACMLATGTQKIETKLFCAWVQKNGRPSVILRDGEEIPETFKRTRVEFDSTAAYESWREWKRLKEAAEEMQRRAETCEMPGEKANLHDSARAFLEEADKYRLPDSIAVIEGSHLRIK